MVRTTASEVKPLEVMMLDRESKKNPVPTEVETGGYERILF